MRRNHDTHTAHVLRKTCANRDESFAATRRVPREGVGVIRTVNFVICSESQAFNKLTFGGFGGSGLTLCVRDDESSDLD